MVKNPLNTPETRAKIISRIIDGAGLRGACRDIGVPESTFREWVRADPALAAQYACALEDGHDVEADQIVVLSQKPYEKVPNKNGALVIDPGEVQARKLEIDTRKWILARRAPKKYGDRVTTELSGPDGGPVQVAPQSLDEITRSVIFTLTLAEKKGALLHNEQPGERAGE